MVLDVDSTQRRLSLGLKASYFDGAGDAEDGKSDAEVHLLSQALSLYLIWLMPQLCSAKAFPCGQLYMPAVHSCCAT